MKADFDKFAMLADFDNVLVTDNKGYILFYDLADINILKKLGHRPEEFIGKNITTFYKNLSAENSTIMNVLKTGQALSNVEQEMVTKTGSVYFSKSSTFPIKHGETIIGTIEFSKHYVTKENIQYLDQYAGHKIFRKNNTIYTIDDIITSDSKMETIKKKIEKVARTDSTILIYGQTGTGKEVVAQAIHNLSDRFGKPFISINCSAIPANLIESTLFGTTKGSFTGSEDKQGLFEQADGGTLFLDEINSLDMNLQVKLLKAIEEKMVRRIGGKKNIPLDIRIISATNEDPEILVAEKRLRQDLYFRLGIVEFYLPTLAERKDDIQVLLEHYIKFYSNHMKIWIDGVSDEVLDCFMNYDWPGNVRELRNAVETGFNSAISTTITLEDIPQRIRKNKRLATSIESPTHLSKKTLKAAVDEYEKSIIENELKSSNTTMAETARRLGLSKQSLKYKIDKYQLG